MFNFFAGACVGSAITGIVIVIYIDFVMRAIDEYTDWSDE